MKVRNGFVSNSSSSSFVVVYRVAFRDKECGVSNEMVEKLLNFGFKWRRGYPNSMIFDNNYNPRNFPDSVEDFDEYEYINLYHDVICNQDEVSDFLFENKIPFIASMHNDEELWVYKGGDYYEVIQNFAIQFLQNDVDFKEEPYKKIYLKKD